MNQIDQDIGILSKRWTKLNYINKLDERIMSTFLWDLELKMPIIRNFREQMPNHALPYTFSTLEA